MKKIIAAILSLTLLAAMATGCGGTTTSSTAGGGTSSQATSGTADLPKIGVCIYKYDDTYISTVRQALEKEGVGKAELLINDGKNDQGTQNDQVDLMLENGVKALLVNIVDIGASQAIVDKAKAKDVPVIFFNREPSADVIKSYDKARFVGTNAKEAGVIQGDIIAKTWETGKYDTNGDGKMQYVMFKGNADNPEAVARTEWSIKTAESKGVKTDELALQVCDWDAELANKAMEAWISKNTVGDKLGIEFVVANNDGMAQGAITALQAAGYNKGEGSTTIPVVGVDATDIAKDYIEKGYMTGSVLQDGPAMAKALFAVGMNAAAGKEFIDGTSYKYDESGIAVRIPYQPYEAK